MTKSTLNFGRLLLTLVDVVTILAPFGADWNRSHIFNEQWPSHARFHAVVGLSMPSILAGFAAIRLWMPKSYAGDASDFAAVVPMAYWGSFLPAVLIRGTGVDDEPYPVGQIVGVPANLFYAALTTALAFGGWLLERQSRKTA